MPLAKSNFARSLWAVKQALFPSFEEKRYHLQFRHATLIGLTLMCASFTMPAYHQTMPFADSLFNTSPDIPVEAGYNKIQRFLGGVMHWNIAIAVWMALNIIIEAIVQRSAPVWYEIIWMLLVVAGQGVSLGLIASSRPVNICDRSYPIVPIPDVNGGFVPSNSALAICSNWRGMTGLLAAIICVFMIHVTWHVIVTVRHRALRQTVWVLPITDYRWNLPAQLQRVNTVFPGDVEKALPADSKDEKQTESQFSSGDYTSKGSHPDTLSFPGSVSINEEYSNYSRPSNASKLQALPANSKPVILQQSIITRSDTESIIESDRASSPQSPKEPAPFSYSNRI